MYVHFFWSKKQIWTRDVINPEANEDVRKRAFDVKSSGIVAAQQLDVCESILRQCWRNVEKLMGEFFVGTISDQNYIRAVIVGNYYVATIITIVAAATLQ